MINNVTLVIGDNAAGKTRYLEQLKENFMKKGLRVISNLDGYTTALDFAKKEIIIQKGSCYLNDLLQGNLHGVYDSCAYKLLQYILSNGDVLIIDELDSNLIDQHILDFCIMLSQLRVYWKEIIVSGYNDRLMRIFTYITYDVDGYIEEEKTLVNLTVLAQNKIRHINNEVEAYENFDTIRR